MGLLEAYLPPPSFCALDSNGLMLGAACQQ